MKSAPAQGCERPCVLAEKETPASLWCMYTSGWPLDVIIDQLIEKVKKKKAVPKPVSNQKRVASG